MKAVRFLAAAVFCTSPFAAQATVYSYTGNTFTFDTINSTPSHVVATFDFDFANSTFASLFNTYLFKSWDVRAGSVHFSSANGDVLANRFSFDSNMNITGWYFSAYPVSWDRAVGNVQSLSANYSAFAPNLPANDLAWAGTETADIHDSQGTWSVSNEVPEPASLLLLGVGGMAYASLLRRQRRNC